MGAVLILIRSPSANYETRCDIPKLVSAKAKSLHLRTLANVRMMNQGEQNLLDDLRENDDSGAFAEKDESNLSDENTKCEPNRATHVNVKAESARGADFVRKPLLSETKHIVNLRDGGRCTSIDDQGERCTQTRWLDIHHIVEVASGGDNSPGNLRTVCSHHHRRIHEKREPVS